MKSLQYVRHTDSRHLLLDILTPSRSPSNLLPESKHKGCDTRPSRHETYGNKARSLIDPLGKKQPKSLKSP